MPNVYLTKSVYERLLKFIQKSRVSPEFGAPNKFKNEEEAVEFLLSIGEKFSLTTLETLLDQPFISGEIKEEVYDKEVAEAKEGAKNG